MARAAPSSSVTEDGPAAPAQTPSKSTTVVPEGEVSDTARSPSQSCQIVRPVTSRSATTPAFKTASVEVTLPGSGIDFGTSLLTRDCKAQPGVTVREGVMLRVGDGEGVRLGLEVEDGVVVAGGVPEGVR